MSLVFLYSCSYKKSVMMSAASSFSWLNVKLAIEKLRRPWFGSRAGNALCCFC